MNKIEQNRPTVSGTGEGQGIEDGKDKEWVVCFCLRQTSGYFLFVSSILSCCDALLLQVCSHAVRRSIEEDGKRRGE